jgi:hypothetical protein
LKEAPPPLKDRSRPLLAIPSTAPRKKVPRCSRGGELYVNRREAIRVFGRSPRDRLSTAPALRSRAPAQLDTFQCGAAFGTGPGNKVCAAATGVASTSRCAPNETRGREKPKKEVPRLPGKLLWTFSLLMEAIVRIL